MSYISTTYTVQVEIEKPAEIVFQRLSDLSQWWPEDFSGEPLANNSQFVLTTGDGHYSINKVIAFVPNERIAWQTIESLRKADNFDWSGTKFIFELTATANTTVVRFTYDGVIFEHEREKLVQICDITLKQVFLNYMLTK